MSDPTGEALASAVEDSDTSPAVTLIKEALYVQKQMRDSAALVPAEQSAIAARLMQGADLINRLLTLHIRMLSTSRFNEEAKKAIQKTVDGASKKA